MTARIAERIEKLADKPRPSGCKKLRGGVNEWRIRIGDYRVVYTVDDGAKAIGVMGIAHRKKYTSYEPQGAHRRRRAGTLCPARRRCEFQGD
jgi:mRNA interferase RelE/StbE